MLDCFSRTELLIGNDAIEKLSSSRVAVFGVGGVGGYTVEALARSAVGAIDIIDNDTICPSNINRQIFALTDTVGEYKVDAAQKRIKSINPDCIVTKHKVFYGNDTADMFDFSSYDYVVDAVDTVSAKLELVMRAKAADTPIISSMGAGNKMNPAAFTVADIYETSVCPLARVMRRELRNRGVESLKVVYSREKPIAVSNKAEVGSADTKQKSAVRRQVPGSNAFVPPTVGMIIASEVIKDLIGWENE